MTLVEVGLANGFDCVSAECGLLSMGDVRRVHLRVLADSSQIMTALPEDLIDKLGLADDVADWLHSGYPVVNGVLVEADGRNTYTNCIVLPAGATAILGQTVLRSMGLVVDEAEQKLMPDPKSPERPLVRV